MRLFPLLLLIAFVPFFACPARADTQPSGEDILLELHATQAIPRGGNPDSAAGLSLYIRRIGGQWKSGLLLAPRFNSNYHSARVISAERSGRKLKLQVAANLLSDPWVKGGRARYEFDLTLGPEETLEGTFTGSLKGVATSGAAKGWLMDLPESDPAEAGEHPRLLFRKSELPRLRKWAKTPLGRAAVAKMTTAAGLGVRYQLTGEKKLAEQARKLVERTMADRSSGDKGVAHRIWAWRSEEIALAYDLCYDAWPEEFRKQVAQYLAGIADRVFYNHGTFTEYSGWAINDRIGVGLIYGPCLATLAIVGEKTDQPLPVPAEYLDGHDPHKPLPEMELQKADEVPISDFASGAVPGKLLWIGAVPVKKSSQLDADKLAELQLEEGQKVTLIGKTFTAGTFPEKGKWNGRLDIVGANKHKYFTTNLIYTVIRNDKPRWVRFKGNFDGGIVDPLTFLAGKRINDGDVFRLGKGTYPMLLALPVSETNPWGKITCKPVLTELAAEEARTLLKVRLAAAEDSAAEAKAALEHFRSTGTSPRYEELFRIAEGLMYATFRHTVGDGGFQHGYSDVNNMLNGPMKYASCYYRMFGRSPSPRPDITHSLARRVMSAVKQSDGSWTILDINGNAGFDIHGWFESRDVTNETFAALLPITPDEMRQWTGPRWPGFAGGDLEKNVSPLLTGGRNRVGEGKPSLNSLPAWVLAASGPANVETTAPPLFWRADSDGWYAFRDRHQGVDDCLVQVFAKQRIAQKWNRQNAGAVRIQGLGEHWWIGPRSHEQLREFESVPMYTGDWFPDGRGRAKQVWYAPKRKQGGVHVDLSELYATPTANTVVVDNYDGSMTVPGALKSRGITARRVVGVDYSGKSGSPCLVVIVDEFEGASNPHRWIYQLDSKQEEYGKWKIVNDAGKEANRQTVKKLWKQTGKRSVLPRGWQFQITRHKDVPEKFVPTTEAKVQIHGDEFTVSKGRATLRAKLIHTGDNPLELSKDVESILRKRLHGHSHGVDRIGSWAVRTTSKGSFLCVLTIQKGKAPEIKVSGDGLDSVITVGGQTVWYRDGKVVFGEGE
ncbi:MAG: hypothetical protein ACLFVU_05805 [Phycisphaerae bacterium]